MKKYSFQANPIYWVLIPAVLAGLWWLSHIITGYQSGFLGFAENKQSDINTDQDMYVVKIHVSLGDYVKKGDTLVTGMRQDLDEAIQQSTLTSQSLTAKIEKDRLELLTEIDRLRNEKETKSSAIQSKIDQAKEEINFFKNLTDSRVDPENDIPSLEKELATVIESYDKLIEKYHVRLKTPNPIQAQILMEDAKKGAAERRKRQLIVTAPFEGIIGNLDIRENESIEAFTTLLSMYEPTPPIVVGYISEKYNSKISAGDSVLVSSLYHQDKNSAGIVMTKGHRIIEIPEKFRKVADIKTYGVEVFIKINQGNKFLQKEVLRIQKTDKQ